MTFTPGTSGNPGAKVRHGFYRKRERHCDACGTVYVARRLTSRFCSDPCRVQHGAWSFKVVSKRGQPPRVVLPRQ